jgi:hypothetical protein
MIRKSGEMAVFDDVVEPVQQVVLHVMSHEWQADPAQGQRGQDQKRA